MNEFSEIAGSATVKSPEGLEHPVHLSPQTEVHAGCTVGRYTFVNKGSVLFPHVHVGRYCSIARNCEIGAANHPVSFLSTHTFQYHSSYFPKWPAYRALSRRSWRAHPPTRIGNDVWIGAKCVVKSGVTIGDGAVVAAGAVVTKDIPPYAIMGGVPAKIVRMRFPPGIIAELLRLRWWDLEVERLGGLPFDEIEACIEALRQLEAPAAATCDALADSRMGSERASLEAVGLPAG